MRARTLVLASFAMLILTACGGSGGGGGGGGGNPMQPGATCANIAGAWNAVWNMSPCGPDVGGSATVTITQIGCSVSFSIPGLGTFTGTLDGNRSSPNLTLQFGPNAPGSGPACPNPSQGGLRVQADGSIFLPFGTGPPPCCQHGSVTFTR